MNNSKPFYKILAPISGQTMDLTKVPDPVFAEKLTGDGLAIKLSSDEVLAPCDGCITLFFETKHAFAMTTPEGIQILVHIGLDSIVMNGYGLYALHKTNDFVKAGTPILKVDLPMLQKKEINLISPIIVINHTKLSQLKATKPFGFHVEAGTDDVLQFSL